MTHLRKMQLDELQRRNYAQSTSEAYIRALKEFADYSHRSPDQLGPKGISQFQLHLLRDRKLSPQTVKQQIAALRFFFNRTLKRRYPPSEFCYPKAPSRRLLAILFRSMHPTRLGFCRMLRYRSCCMSRMSRNLVCPFPLQKQN